MANKTKVCKLRSIVKSKRSSYRKYIIIEISITGNNARINTLHARTHLCGIKFLTGNFTGVPIMNFRPDCESEIVNQSGLQTNSSEN